MFALPMFDKILSLVDGDPQYENIWQLRTIRFDLDPDEERKAFEKYIIISYNVEDNKGNPGMRGQLFVTNLRLIWQLTSDSYVNLSIGWDTVTSASIKTLPVGNSNSFKYLMSLKTQNMSQNRYQFKFMGFSAEDHNVFQKIVEIQQIIVQTKNYRCLNLALRCEPNYEILNHEQVKSEYAESIFSEDQIKIKSNVILTNVRIIILKEQQKKMNYSIPWLMVRYIQKLEDDDRLTARILCRGILSSKQLILSCRKGADMKKLYLELKTFSETYNKTPCLGYSFMKQNMVQQQQVKGRIKREQIQQIEGTKVKLRRGNKAYESKQGFGLLQHTEFDEQLGLMMEKLPQKTTRAELWQILRD